MEFRRGLPVDYLAYMGVANSDGPETEKRAAFLKASVNRINKFNRLLSIRLMKSILVYKID